MFSLREANELFLPAWTVNSNPGVSNSQSATEVSSGMQGQNEARWRAED